MSEELNKQKHNLSYKPEIEYVDEYDSSATIVSDNIDSNATIPKPNDPTQDIQDNFDKIDVFLPGLNDDIRGLIEGIYLPLKDYWEEIKDLEYDRVPESNEITVLDPDSQDDDSAGDNNDGNNNNHNGGHNGNNNSNDYEDNDHFGGNNNDENDNIHSPNYGGGDESDDDLPPADVLDSDKIDDLIHIIEIEYPRHVIVDKEYAKNTKDLLNFYTEGLVNAISDYWVQVAPIIMGAPTEKKLYILKDFKSYNPEDNKDISVDKKHILDYAVRTEIFRQQKIAFLKKMFPTDETILKLRNYKAAQELRKKYANMKTMSEHTKEASDHNAFLEAATLVYDSKYDDSYAALYKYFNSANKTLGDMFNLAVQEQKAKQYLKK